MGYKYLNKFIIFFLLVFSSIASPALELQIPFSKIDFEQQLLLQKSPDQIEAIFEKLLDIYKTDKDMNFSSFSLAVNEIQKNSYTSNYLKERIKKLQTELSLLGGVNFKMNILTEELTKYSKEKLLALKILFIKNNGVMGIVNLKEISDIGLYNFSRINHYLDFSGEIYFEEIINRKSVETVKKIEAIKFIKTEYEYDYPKGTPIEYKKKLAELAKKI